MHLQNYRLTYATHRVFPFLYLEALLGRLRVVLVFASLFLVLETRVQHEFQTDALGCRRAALEKSDCAHVFSLPLEQLAALG